MIVLLGVAHALDHSFLSVLPPVLLLIVKDLDVSLAEVGVAATFAYLLFGAGALVGGPLSDRIGEGKVVFISLALSGLSTFVLLAYQGFHGLAAALVLMAGWSSFYHPTANSLISKAYSAEVGHVMGIHGIGGSVGQVFVPSAAVLLAVVLGWRFSFIFFGVLSMITSLYFMRLPSVGRRERGARPRGSSILKERRFWVLLACNIMIGLYFRGTELFFPAYLTSVRGMSIEIAGVATSLLMAFGVLGQFLGGIGSDRIGAANALVIESTAVVAGFACLQIEGLAAAGMFLVLFGIAFQATQPTTNVLTSEMSSLDQRGLMYGIMFLTVFGLGSVSSTIAGYVAESSGLQPAFTVMLILSVLALSSSLFLRREWSPKETTHNQQD